MVRRLGRVYGAISFCDAVLWTELVCALITKKGLRGETCRVTELSAFSESSNNEKDVDVSEEEDENIKVV